MLVALAVIAVASLATLAAWRLRPPPPPPPAQSNEPLFDFDPKSVRAIAIRSWQGTLRAERTAAGWHVSEVRLRAAAQAAASDAAAPGTGGEPTPSAAEAGDIVSALVREVIDLPVIDRFPRGDRALADFGLAEPQATIALTLDDATTRTLEIGSLTIASSALYARAAPPDDVVQVGTLVFSAIDSALFRLRAFASPAPGEPGTGAPAPAPALPAPRGAHERAERAG